MIIFLFILAQVSLLLFIPALVGAQTYTCDPGAKEAHYVSPSGSGTVCTEGSPCSLSEGMSQANNDDYVILKNGTYQQRLVSIRAGSSSINPIVICAENYRQARILHPPPGSSYSAGGRSNTPLVVEDSNITVKGLEVDGSTISHGLITVAGFNGSPISNIIIEHNHAHDSGATLSNMQDINNVIMRYNLLERSGFHNVGEGTYLGGSNAVPIVDNVEIHNNIIREAASNDIDFKGNVGNAHVHHNIYEGHKRDHNGFPGDGLVRSGPDTNSGNVFEDNILRNGINRYIFRFRGRVDAFNNVFYNIQTDNGTFIQSDSTSSLIKNNTACNAGTGGANAISNWTPNSVGQPQSVCDAEVARILSEMEGEVSETPAFDHAYVLRTDLGKIYIKLVDPNGGISVGSATGFSAQVESSPVTISAASCSSTVAGFAVCTLTHNGTVDESSDVIIVSYSDGNVVDGQGEELTVFTNASATNWYSKVWNTDVVIDHTEPDGSPVSSLFDDDINTEASSLYVTPGPTMFVEFDTINSISLDSATVAGDASGNFFCLTYDLEAKMNAVDSYVTIINDQDCNQRELVTTDFTSLTEARFWKFTFTGPSEGVQAFEIDSEEVEGVSPPVGDWFIATTDGGDCSTIETACGVNEALNSASSGDVVVFTDGTYNCIETTKSGLTYKAQNKHQAIITGAGSCSTQNIAFEILHSNSVIDGLRINNGNSGGGTHGTLRFGAALNNITVRNSIIENSTGLLISVCGSINASNDCSDIVIEDNIIRDSGNNSTFGEGIYIGTFDSANHNTVTNVTIRRNIFQEIGCEQQIDVKPGARNVEVYHNIFEDQDLANAGSCNFDNQGQIYVSQGEINFHDNIVRNNNKNTNNVNFLINAEANAGFIQDNVMYNNDFQGDLISEKSGSVGGPNTEVSGNVFCNNSGTNIDSSFFTHDNTFHSGMHQDCIDRENEILALMSGEEEEETFTLSVTLSGTGTGGVESSPSGIDCGEDCQEDYNVDTQVTLTATATGNSTFTGWSGSCSGLGDCVVTMDNSHNILAAFNVLSYTLTVNVSGDGTGGVVSSPVGIDCGEDCDELYEQDTQVTLTPTPTGESIFKSWIGACAGTGTCIVTMDGHKTATVTFDLPSEGVTILDRIFNIIRRWRR